LNRPASGSGSFSNGIRLVGGIDFGVSDQRAAGYLRRCPSTIRIWGNPPRGRSCQNGSCILTLKIAAISGV
jgi:hypothetical protein